MAIWTKSNDTEADERSPWTRPAFIVSGTVVALLVVLALVLALTGPSGDPGPGRGAAPAPAAPSHSAPSPGTPSSKAASDSVCGLSAGDQSVPSSPPPTTWKLIGSTAAPSSEAAGPGTVTEGVRTCFAHNPVGALFAAATFSAETTAPQVSKAQLAKATIASGPGKSAAVRSARKADAGDPDTTLVFQFAGYRFLDYSPDRATLELVWRITSGPNAGALSAVPYTVAWEDGDWKITVSADGEVPSGNSVPDLSGYVPWSGA